MMKDYIEQEYKKAAAEAVAGDKEDALRQLRRLEELAATSIGFEFADYLHYKYLPCG